MMIRKIRGSHHPISIVRGWFVNLNVICYGKPAHHKCDSTSNSSVFLPNVWWMAIRWVIFGRNLFLCSHARTHTYILTNTNSNTQLTDVVWVRRAFTCASRTTCFVLFWLSFLFCMQTRKNTWWNGRANRNRHVHGSPQKIYLTPRSLKRLKVHCLHIFHRPRYA